MCIWSILFRLQERIRQQKAIKAERERQEAIELEKKRRIEGQQLIVVKQRYDGCLYANLLTNLHLQTTR